MDKKGRRKSSEMRRKDFMNIRKHSNWGSEESDCSVSSVSSFSSNSLNFWSLHKGYRGSLLKLSDLGNSSASLLQLRRKCAFKMNIALKYVRPENVININIFKFSQVKYIKYIYG